MPAASWGLNLDNEAVRHGWRVSAQTRQDWDVTDPQAAQHFMAADDLVVNCAAVSNADVAEADPDRAYAVNVTGPQYIAHACARVGAQLLHISSDYVFGGEKRHPYDVGDPTHPLSVYRRTKLAGELAMLPAQSGATVVRTSWIYTGGAGSDFVAVMRRHAAAGDTVEVADDQIGSPIYVKDLVGALLGAGAGRIREPILHAANAGAVSRYEQARAVFEELGADRRLVRPVTSAAAGGRARRPVYSALSMARSGRAGPTLLRPWRDALAEALAGPSAD